MSPEPVPDEPATSSEFCDAHLSRRAVGICEACGSRFCTPCWLDGHVCPGAPDPPPPRRRLAWLALPALVVAIAVFAARMRPEVAATSPHVERTPHRPLHRVPTVTVPLERSAGAPRPPVTAIGSFDRGSPRRRSLLLSFDAGSTDAGASEVLDVLAARDVRTTFFLTGAFIREHPDIVNRMVALGEEIGNHTDTHPHLTTWATEHRQRTRPGIDDARLRDELELAAESFHRLTGLQMAPLWRAPYGEINDALLACAARAGWRHVGWSRSFDALDWVSDPGSSLYRSADEIANRLLSLADHDPESVSGVIVLMHLGSDRPPRDRLGRVLPRLIDGFRERGFELVTASDMMRGS
jgi:peptidoglycan/xylan/chitin deacetylase (PgdA/CDA1 family)